MGTEQIAVSLRDGVHESEKRPAGLLEKNLSRATVADDGRQQFDIGCVSHFVPEQHCASLRCEKLLPATSSLRFPCNANKYQNAGIRPAQKFHHRTVYPPSTITAVDLVTGQAIWSKPLGDGRDSGPFGIRSHLPFTMGVPMSGGSVTTRGGLMFIGATVDGMFRAFDTATGEELWGVSPLRDQGLAGAVMMIEGSLVTIGALAWLFLRLAQEGELRQELLERGHDPRAVRRAVRYRRAQELDGPR